MDVPTGILVEIRGNGSLGREEAMMAALAELRGIPVVRGSGTQVPAETLWDVTVTRWQELTA